MQFDLSFFFSDNIWNI